MITLNEFLDAVQYKITAGGEYYLDQWEENGYYPDQWVENGYYLESMPDTDRSFSILFDPNTYVVYDIEVIDNKRRRAYRLINPEYRKQWEKFVKTSSHYDVNTAYDDVKFTDLEDEKDFSEKMWAIYEGMDYDSRVTIPLENIDDELLLKLFKMAHERDMTFNEFINSELSKEYADILKKREPMSKGL